MNKCWCWCAQEFYSFQGWKSNEERRKQNIFKNKTKQNLFFSSGFDARFQALTGIRIYRHPQAAGATYLPVKRASLNVHAQTGFID